MSISPKKTKKEDEEPPPTVVVQPPPPLPPVQTLLSKDQAHELWEVLQEEPLTGRSVLIPLGKYAFIPGRLQPHRLRRRQHVSDATTGRTASSGDGSEGQQQPPPQQIPEEEEEEEEVVTIHDGSATFDTTRSKAQEWLLSGTGGARRPHKSNNTKVQPTTQSRSSSLLPSTTTTHHNSPPPPPPSVVVAPPMVDIQEEYDADGNPVQANVVDMNRRLESLWKLGMDDDDDQEETKMDPTVNWMDTILQPSSRRHPSPLSPATLHEEAPPLKSLDDEEYNRLSQRLEELARLEEQEQQGNVIRNRSRGKAPKPATSSGGWKKGFLCSSTTASSSQKKSPKITSTNPNIPPRDNAAMAPSLTRESSRSVQIDITQNQVHEIPRIGTQKVPPKQQQHQQHVSFEAPPTAAGAISPADMEQQEQERPFLDPSVFSGVIQERRPMVMERTVVSKREATTSTSSLRQPPTPPLPSAPTSRDTVPSARMPSRQQPPTKQPPKRMSRFAQEQMEK